MSKSSSLKLFSAAVLALTVSAEDAVVTAATTVTTDPTTCFKINASKKVDTDLLVNSDTIMIGEKVVPLPEPVEEAAEEEGAEGEGAEGEGAEGEGAEGETADGGAATGEAAAENGEADKAADGGSRLLEGEEEGAVAGAPDSAVEVVDTEGETAAEGEEAAGEGEEVVEEEPEEPYLTPEHVVIGYGGCYDDS